MSADIIDLPELPDLGLAELARAHQVATDYWDWQGEHVEVGAATIRAVLEALGVPAATDAQVAESLSRAADAPWRRTLPPTIVLREGQAPRVAVHLPHGAGLRLSIELEDGTHRGVRQVEHIVTPRIIDGREVGEAMFELPGDLPLGYHRLTVHSDAPPVDPDTVSAALIVTPAQAPTPAALGVDRAMGISVQLYQVRSPGSWGAGDLADLAELGGWAAQQGADFIQVNPLHAAEPIAPMEPSPYLPTTRQRMNPIYLRIEDIPEIARLGQPEFRRVQELAATAQALNSADRIDRDQVWAAKREALGLIHEVGLTGARAADYGRFLDREGDSLTAYATWCGLTELFGTAWTDWPPALHDPGGVAVQAFRQDLVDVTDLHCWMQWLLARQFAQAQREALAAGMRLGIVTDLAVGVCADGADTWMLRSVLAAGIGVGAPPDQYNQLGQDWQQPPWHPRALAAAGYEPFRAFVRAALRDAGGIRVDHIIGLFRLWWVPAGMSPHQGTYVRYDHEALVGILALEAHRAGAVVIGEDLGVVEPMARDYLRERGILGTSIMWFEWVDGAPRLPQQYRELCLSSVTTHDLPPTAGYLELAHLVLREQLGLLIRDPQIERDQARAAIETVLAALVDAGLLDPDAGPQQQIVAMHRWLAATPSALLAVALADLVGDRRAINQPGTIDEYPNWRVPLADPAGRPIGLEEITRGTAVRGVGSAILAAVGRDPDR